MTPLFISLVCDYCDAPPDGGRYEGFVVWRGGPSPLSAYVFQSFKDAELYRGRLELSDREVRRVLATAPIEWTAGHGKTEWLTVADRLYEIYRDHLCPPGPHRAYLAPFDDDLELDDRAA